MPIPRIPRDAPANTTLTSAKVHYLVFVGRVEDGGDGDDGFTFSYSRNPAEPWTSAFTVLPTTADTWATAVVDVHLGALYIRATDTDRAPGTTAPDRLLVIRRYIVRIERSIEWRLRLLRR